MDNKDGQGKKKRKAEPGNLSIDIPTGGSGDSKVPGYGGGNAGGAGSSRGFMPQPAVPATDLNADTNSFGEILPVLSSLEETVSTVTQGVTGIAEEFLDVTTEAISEVAGTVADITIGAVEVAGSAVCEVAEQAVEVAGEIIAGIISS